MASMTFVAASIPKFRSLGRSTVLRNPAINTKLYAGTAPRMVQVFAQQEAGDKAVEAAKQGMTEVRRSAENVKNAAGNAAGSVGEMGSKAASRVVETAKDMGDKAKQTAQGAWDSARETGEKMKDAVVGTAEGASAAVKDNVEQSMNSKNVVSP